MVIMETTTNLTNSQIMNKLRENNLLLNVYVSDGMFITRVVKNDETKTAVSIASRNTLEASVQRAMSKIKA